jgi:hypothetical protein
MPEILGRMGRIQRQVSRFALVCREWPPTTAGEAKYTGR